jgi:hypothetical protein
MMDGASLATTILTLDLLTQRRQVRCWCRQRCTAWTTSLIPYVLVDAIEEGSSMTAFFPVM